MRSLTSPPHLSVSETAPLLAASAPLTPAAHPRGAGKTFVMAEVVRALRRPALILAPNKTLAAQLTRELAALLPGSAVELFVSHFSVYVPEAFHGPSNTFIPKTSVVNEQLDAMRHRATRVRPQ